MNLKPCSSNRAVRSLREGSMFFARRPSRATIERFVRDSKDLPLSYSPAGIVSGGTAHPGLGEVVTVIGRGRADFDRARAALAAWKHFDLGWVELFPSHARSRLERSSQC